MMKKILMALMGFILSLTAMAQQAAIDTTTFKGRYYNKEYDVYIQLDAYHPTVVVPGQEIYGELPGYLGDSHDARKWLFTDAQVVDTTYVTLAVINDYGSEDLVATFTHKKAAVFELKQGEGSTIKIARNRKWVKLPKVLVFVKQ